ncbi:hypothetical protein [Nevskia sp.]|uniref:hypothetical protein n=1 Tax=Nevskia sp. TaxID=1929292 RepID=UPI0025EF86C9|nr:hypothetical protein [Nevskia sp.]
MSATTEAELQAAAITTRRMVEILAAVASGGPELTINNGSVDLPSIAKLFAGFQAQANAAIAAIAATSVIGRNPRKLFPSTAAIDPPINGGLRFEFGGQVTMEYENGFTETVLLAPQTDWLRNPVRILVEGTDVGIDITGYGP